MNPWTPKPISAPIKKRLTILLLLVVFFIFILKENLTKRPDRLYLLTNGQIEMCLACHKQESLDPAHNTAILGCFSCHLGNPLAGEKKEAHKGIVKNPGDLRIVSATCGKNYCHAKDVKLVKNSLMATNRGILATLCYYWGEAPNQQGDYSVEKLLNSGDNSLAIDYFRKLCATCHLWKQKGDLPGYYGEKGGGCTACHSISQSPSISDPKEKKHPLISKNVPIDKCLRCHNRSGRIGISYNGIYEIDEDDELDENKRINDRRLPDDRFFIKLSDDIHHNKNMACIDCHTRAEIMGDGTNHAHYETALEITCRTCHIAPSHAGEKPFAPMLPGMTSKGNRLTHIRKNDADRNTPDSAPTTPYVLIGKLDNLARPLNPPKAIVCDYAGHRRLTCASCHSTWVPQCYGCHIKLDKAETHLDKLKMVETPGWWQEETSVMKYDRPSLALWDDRVVVITPGCQDMVTIKEADGRISKSFNSLTVAAISPHTSQKQARGCLDCHANPKALGLGEGKLWQEQGHWRFAPLNQGENTALGHTPPLDAFGDLDGRQLQKGFRPNLRPFNKMELERILKVGLCLKCHKDFSDRAFKGYSAELECRKR